MQNLGRKDILQLVCFRDHDVWWHCSSFYGNNLIEDEYGRSLFATTSSRRDKSLTCYSLLALSDTNKDMKGGLR